MKCTYRGCGKSRRNSPGLRIYGFPTKDEKRCKQWIINSGNSLDIPLSKYEIKGLCQYHFITEDFVNETKHRLIQIAVPLHYNDPLGHARRKEREKEFKKSETKNESESAKNKIVLLRKDLPVQSDKSDNETNNEKTSRYLKEHSFLPKQCKLRISNKKDEKVRCYVKKIYKKDHSGVSLSNQRLQWLDEVLKKRALNKNKNVAYYINVNDLLGSFDIPNSTSEFEFPYHDRNNENKKVRCYSRKNVNVKDKSSCLFSTDGNKNCFADANDPLSLEEYNVVGHINEYNDKAMIENGNDIPPSTNICCWKDEGKICHTNPTEGDADEDVKDERILECQFQWSEEEDDKSLIKIIDVSKLQSGNHREGTTDFIKSEDIHVSRIYNRKVKRKRHFNYMTKTSETEKCMYIINRNHIHIRKLRNELRRCRKELKKLQKIQGEGMSVQRNSQLFEEVDHLNIVHEPKI